MSLKDYTVLQSSIEMKSYCVCQRLSIIQQELQLELVETVKFLGIDNGVFSLERGYCDQFVHQLRTTTQEHNIYLSKASV